MDSLTHRFIKIAWVLYGFSAFFAVFSLPSLLGFFPSYFKDFFIYAVFPVYMIALPLEILGEFLEGQRPRPLNNILIGLILMTNTIIFIVGFIELIFGCIIAGIIWFVCGIIEALIFAKTLRLSKLLKREIEFKHERSQNG